MIRFRFICMKYSINFFLITLSFFLLGYVNAQVYYVSSSQGNDENDGLRYSIAFSIY